MSSTWRTAGGHPAAPSDRASIIPANQVEIYKVIMGDDLLPTDMPPSASPRTSVTSGGEYLHHSNDKHEIDTHYLLPQIEWSTHNPGQMVNEEPTKEGNLLGDCPANVGLLNVSSEETPSAPISPARLASTRRTPSPVGADAPPRSAKRRMKRVERVERF